MVSCSQRPSSPSGSTLRVPPSDGIGRILNMVERKYLYYLIVRLCGEPLDQRRGGASRIG